MLTFPFQVVMFRYSLFISLAFQSECIAFDGVGKCYLQRFQWECSNKSRVFVWGYRNMPNWVIFQERYCQSLNTSEYGHTMFNSHRTMKKIKIWTPSFQLWLRRASQCSMDLAYETALPSPMDRIAALGSSRRWGTLISSSLIEKGDGGVVLPCSTISSLLRGGRDCWSFPQISDAILHVAQARRSERYKNMIVVITKFKGLHLVPWTTNKTPFVSPASQ